MDLGFKVKSLVILCKITKNIYILENYWSLLICISKRFPYYKLCEIHFFVVQIYKSVLFCILLYNEKKKRQN